MKHFKKDGIALTNGNADDAEEELFQRFGKLVRLPGWSSARDVYECIIPAMYTARAGRLVSSATKGGSIAGREELIRSSSKTPYTEEDVRQAFVQILKSRQESQRARGKVLRNKDTDQSGGGDDGVRHNDGEQSQRFRPQEKVNYKHVENEISGEASGGEPGESDTDFWTSLEEACKELGYDLTRMEEIFSSRNFPEELLNLVRQKTKKSSEAIRGMLEPQCERLLQNVRTLLRQQAEEQSREEHLKQEKIRKLGRCPMDFEWIKVEGGYRCAGGTHFCTDNEIAAFCVEA